MTNDMIPSSDISTWPNIYPLEPSQMATIVKEDDVKDFHDDDISTKVKDKFLLKS
jgi:hypothetical protein